MNNLYGALHSSSVRILPPSIHASILFDQRSPVNVEKKFLGGGIFSSKLYTPNSCFIDHSQGFDL